MICKDIAKLLPVPKRLMSEYEWRNLGVQQSLGWVHYMLHDPEPHILVRSPSRLDPGLVAQYSDTKCIYS